MGENTRQIVEDIRAERHELGRNLEELEAQAKDLADWRTHYRRHPGAAIAIAFSGGVVLGLLGAGSPGGLRDIDTDAVRRDASPRSRHAGFNALKALGDNPRARQQLGDTWNEILETLIGLASVKAVNVIGNLLPGFRDEYEARHTRVR